MLRVTGDPIAAVPQLRAAVATHRLPGSRSKGSRRWTRSSAGARAVALQHHRRVRVQPDRARLCRRRTRRPDRVRRDPAHARDRRQDRAGRAAARRRVVLVKEGWWMTLAGLAGGLLAAWILRRSVASMLFGICAGRRGDVRRRAAAAGGGRAGRRLPPGAPGGARRSGGGAEKRMMVPEAYSPSHGSHLADGSAFAVCLGLGPGQSPRGVHGRHGHHGSLAGRAEGGPGGERKGRPRNRP